MKRFTDTGKWAKAWFQDLPPHLKCLWLYLCDAADAAGVWDTNWKLASSFIGKTVSEKDMAAFGDRVRPLPGGKYGIVSFIEFQYGKLSKDCKAHIPIFRALEKHSLSIPYPKAIHSLQEEDKETEEEKETETEGEMQEGGAFDEFWKAYPLRVGKATALASWKKHECAKVLPEILTAIRKCKISPAWTKDGGQFIPHPTTWLNREGWHDELPGLRNGNPPNSINEGIKPNIITCDDQ